MIKNDDNKYPVIWTFPNSYKITEFANGDIEQIFPNQLQSYF